MAFLCRGNFPHPLFNDGKRRDAVYVHFKQRLEQERRFFEKHPADAKKLTGVEDADLAAWTMLSSVVLNLDETLTKE